MFSETLDHTGAPPVYDRVQNWHLTGGSFLYLGQIKTAKAPWNPSTDTLHPFNQDKALSKQGYYWQMMMGDIDSYKGGSGRLANAKGYYNQIPVRTRSRRLAPLQFGGRVI
mgnify:CR=1 FL=1